MHAEDILTNDVNYSMDAQKLFSLKLARRESKS